MKKIFAIGFAAFMLASCNMDFYSSDAMTSSQLADNPASAVYTTDGIYSLFKDYLAYKGESPDYPNGRNQYLRHYFQLTELRSDNVTVSGTTSDPFVHPYDYQDVPTEENIYYTWWLAYKVIYGANSNIDAITPGASAESDHLLGENYFLRALGHFHMVTLFAMPYKYWKEHQDSPGVIVHRGMDSSSGSVKRETVGKVYEGIVEDLIEAQKYLGSEDIRTDRGYASMDAAKALLARVYLYMEENQKCLDVCNDLMGHAPSAVTAGYDYATYPTKTYDFDETIWCVRTSTTDKFFQDHPTSSIGSMYYNSGTQGWGEHYWSEELIDLFQRYPQDKRFAAYFLMKDLRNDGSKMITFPIKLSSTNTTTADGVVHKLTPNPDGSIDFKYSGKSYKAEPVVENTYTKYYVNGVDFITGKTGASLKSRVFVRPDVMGGPMTGEAGDGVRHNGGDYVIYYNTKFSGQDGQPMLTSPAILRWGEVVLNRAEAKAKLGDTKGALDDVNIIRHRAGLTGDADFTEANYQARGYKDVLDVVLDERRMELCFEGHRFFDVFRNGKDLDRRYVGFHEYGIIKHDDPRIALLIPLDEINSSHIPQNRQ